MKICILTHTFPRSESDPTAPFMRDFASGLAESGAEVTIVTPWTDKFTFKEKNFSVKTYKYIWPPALHKRGYSRAMSEDIGLKLYNYILIPFMILGGTLSLIRFVRKEKPDIVNVHWLLPSGLIAYLTSLATGISYMITLPGTDIYLLRKSSLFRLVAKVIANRSSGITSNNNYFLAYIKMN